MVNFLQSLRGLLGFLLFICTVFLSFQGFGFGAFISFFGSALMLMGYQVAVAPMFHKDTGVGDQKWWQRFIAVCLGFAVASIGRAIIDGGGLATINLGSLPISLRYAAVVMGTLGGIWNIDKTILSK